MVILIYKPILVFEKCFNKNWKIYVRTYINYFILINISLISVNFIIKKFFIVKNIFSWFSWIIYAIKISGVSFIIMLIIFLINREFRKFFKGQLKI